MGISQCPRDIDQVPHSSAIPSQSATGVADSCDGEADEQAPPGSRGVPSDQLNSVSTACPDEPTVQRINVNDGPPRGDRERDKHVFRRPPHGRDVAKGTDRRLIPDILHRRSREIEMDVFGKKVRREKEQPSRTYPDDGGIVPNASEDGGPCRPDAPIETSNEPEFPELSE